MNKLLTCVVMLALNFSVFGQISASEYNILKTHIPKETVSLQTNTNLLLAGDYLFYRSTCLNTALKEYSDISKIIYVELIGGKENIIFKHKLKTQNGIAFGDFFIPTSVKTGHYKLIAYTNWSLNNTTESFADINIYIINPYTTESQNIDEPRDSIIIKTEILIKDNAIAINDLYSNNLELNLNKSSYKTRDKVSLDIVTNTSYKGMPYALSVRQIDSVEIVKPINNQNISNTKTDSYYLPELRGEVISGQLLATNNTDVSNQDVTLSFSGDNAILFNAVTNSKGRFYFTVTGDYNTSTINIQVQGSQKENFKIQLDQKLFNRYNQLYFENINLNPNIKYWLESESVQHQIDNAYFDVKTDSVLPLNSNALFYSPLETTYHLDDYTRFKTVRETFIEIISTASLTKRDTTFVFKVPDLVNLEFSRNYTYLDPMVIVDSQLIQDNETIVYYGASKIKSISTVSGLYIYGPSLYNGIISIETFEENFKIPENKNYIEHQVITSVLPIKLYYQPDYSNKADLKRIPDYRKQLLWMPNFFLNKEETVEFYTSDRTGLFEVNLETTSSNGEQIKTVKYFTVSQ